MTAFVLLAFAMAALALALLTRPLWRRAPADVVAADADVQQQLRQIATLQRSGTLTDAQAVEARRRLEQRRAAPVTASTHTGAARPTALIASLTGFVFLVAAAGYLLLGTPRALDAAARTPRAAAADGEITLQQIEAMTEQLAARLKEQPNDALGWAMLGRSYAVLGKHAQALPAFKQALTLKPDDASVLADYADAMAVANGRNLEGEPSRLLARALELDPKNLKALSLAGTAAFLRKDYDGALRYWDQLAKLSPDSEFTQQIQRGIDQARQLAAAGGAAAGGAAAGTTTRGAAPSGNAGPAGGTAAPAGNGAAAAQATLSGTVSLAPALAAQAAPGDTLFVYARAAQGPRMPLAILRKQVKDLPLSFTLDDSMAMSPAAKLSSAPQVVVSARVSKSGQATPQPGDLEGESAPVAPGSRGLKIEIGRVVAR
ncbi:MAG: c-type cytochrome biogenesis protein CcmI [Ideonella sp.]|nr:c-type cytochrome biogenesis protein CcmI [Ideonella sp.]MCC7456119.1 c-type cytochrome biogenesis protein CcmI [Nitrospira sp.]